jgi:hypothetical protein
VVRRELGARPHDEHGDHRDDDDDGGDGRHAAGPHGRARRGCNAQQQRLDHRELDQVAAGGRIPERRHELVRIAVAREPGIDRIELHGRSSRVIRRRMHSASARRAFASATLTGLACHPTARATSSIDRACDQTRRAPRRFGLMRFHSAASIVA